MADFRFSNHGSIWLLYTQTGRADIWCADHLPDDVMTHGRAFVVEHRYVRDIIEGASRDGLTFEVWQ